MQFYKLQHTQSDDTDWTLIIYFGGNNWLILMETEIYLI